MSLQDTFFKTYGAPPSAAAKNYADLDAECERRLAELDRRLTALFAEWERLVRRLRLMIDRAGNSLSPNDLDRLRQLHSELHDLSRQALARGYWPQF